MLPVPPPVTAGRPGEVRKIKDSQSSGTTRGADEKKGRENRIGPRHPGIYAKISFRRDGKEWRFLL